MPTYEYRCGSCGEHVEVFQSFSDDPLSTCGLCGGDLKRVFHPVGIVFKGTGFYSTDSRGESAGGASRSNRSPSESTAPQSQGAASESSRSDSSKSEPKSEPSKSSSEGETKIA